MPLPEIQQEINSFQQLPCDTPPDFSENDDGDEHVEFIYQNRDQILNQDQMSGA